MDAEYIEHQDKHGKTRAISLNVEAVERLNEGAWRFGVPPFSTFLDGGRGIVKLLKRFDIPRKELAAELQVSRATVTNWTRRDDLEPHRALCVLRAVSEILRRRGAADPDADIARYVAPKMAPPPYIDVAKTKRRFAYGALNRLTDPQVDILLEVMRGLMFCNGETEEANELARAIAALEATQK